MSKTLVSAVAIAALAVGVGCQHRDNRFRNDVVIWHDNPPAVVQVAPVPVYPQVVEQYPRVVEQRNFVQPYYWGDDHVYWPPAIMAFPFFNNGCYPYGHSGRNFSRGERSIPRQNFQRPNFQQPNFRPPAFNNHPRTQPPQAPPRPNISRPNPGFRQNHR